MMNLFSDYITPVASKNTFKSSKSLEERLTESNRMLEKFPDRIPVIVEKGNDTIEDIDKKKFLVPKDISVGQFMYVIRKRLTLDSSKSIFLFINNTLPKTSEMMGLEYENKKDEDGFLYVTYSGESTFG